MRVERAVTAVGRVRSAGRAIVERDAETPCKPTLALFTPPDPQCLQPSPPKVKLL